MELTRRPIRLVPLAALAILAAGCGEGSDAASGPAAAIPADAPVYAEASIRPQGDLKSSLESIAGRFPQLGDPGALISSQIDSLLRGEGAPITYAADIQPWLGERAGIALLDPVGDSSEFIAVVETTDEDATNATIGKLAQASSGSTQGSYEGVDYTADGGFAVGVTDGLLIFAPQDGFEAAVNAVEGDPLADYDAYTEQADALPDDSLATAYADPGGILDASVQAGQTPEEEASAVRSLYGGVLDQPFAAALTVADQSLGLELSSGSAPGLSITASSLLEQVPSDAWAAIGVADLGSTLSGALNQLDSLGPALGGADPAAIAKELQRQTGLDLNEVLSSFGDAAAFVRPDPKAVDVGLNVQTTEGSGLADLLATLRKAAGQAGTKLEPPLDPSAEGFSGAPSDSDNFSFVSFQLVDGVIEVAAATDRAAAESRPGDTLGGSALFQAARSGLGDDLEPSLFLDVPTSIQFARAGGSIDPSSYESGRIAFDELSYVAAGARTDGDRVLTRIVLGLTAD